MNNMASVVSIEAAVNGKAEIYLLSDDTGCVAGKHTAEEWITSLENRFMESHRRSYEGSMSACLHYMTFQYRVHAPVDVQTLMPGVVEPGASINGVWGVAGGFTGILCTGPEAVSWHNSGITPKLIDPEEL